MADTRYRDRPHDRFASTRLAILAAFVALPAANYHEFDGIPFDSLPEYLLLLAIAPIVVWPWLRQRWRSALGRPSSRTVTIATVTVVIGVAAKCALFFGGGFAGFAGCYRALDEERRAGLC